MSECRPVWRMRLAEHRPDVFLHRLGGDAELGCDLLVLEAALDEFAYLLLTLGELFSRRRVGRMRETEERALGQLHVTASRCEDRADQRLPVDVRADAAAGTRTDGLAEELVRAIAGYEQHRDGGTAGADVGREASAVEARHLQ